jgi:type II secretory pathway component PulF
MNGRPTRSLVAALVCGAAIPTVLWTALVVGLLFGVSGFKKEFQGFGMRLPAATMFVIEVADWVETYGYVLPLFLSFVLIPDVIIIVLLGRLPNRIPVRLWCGLMIVLPLLAAVLVFFPLYLAHLKLLEGLSK